MKKFLSIFSIFPLFLTSCASVEVDRYRLFTNEMKEWFKERNKILQFKDARLTLKPSEITHLETRYTKNIENMYNPFTIDNWDKYETLEKLANRYAFKGLNELKGWATIVINNKDIDYLNFSYVFEWGK